MASVSALLQQSGHSASVAESVRKLELMLVDINGQIRGKLLHLDPQDDLDTKSILMPASTFVSDFGGDCVEETGLVWDIGDPDFPCDIVYSTLAPMPWQPDCAQVMLAMRDNSGIPFAFDPRATLSAMVERLARRGFSAVAAMEWEFTLSASENRPSPPILEHSQTADTRGGLYDTGKLKSHHALFEAIMQTANAQGVPADTIIAEAAPDQYEINLGHVNDPVLAADHAVMLKRLIKAVARQHGMIASFMAKPYPGLPGNGLHVHTSIVDRAGHNIFAPPNRDSIQTTLTQAIGGLQRTLPATLALLWPNANSFKRVTKKSYAPHTAHWGRNNRNVGLRVPGGDLGATRIEHRYAGADANPYWLMASVLAGIDYGLEHRCTATQECAGMVDDDPTMRLPCSPELAIKAFAESDFIAEYFGATLQKVYSICHEKEIQRFQSMIMPIEYDWFYQYA